MSAENRYTWSCVSATASVSCAGRISLPNIMRNEWEIFDFQLLFFPSFVLVSSGSWIVRTKALTTSIYTLFDFHSLLYKAGTKTSSERELVPSASTLNIKCFSVERKCQQFS